MSRLIRKTITVPENIFLIINTIAASEGKSFSAYVSSVLNEKVTGRKRRKKKIDPMSTLGKYKLGTKEPYIKRSEIYDKHLKRKMGF